MNRTNAPLWLRALSSLRLTTALLACIFVLVLVGTLIQTRDGLWASQQWVFHNWVGGMPFFCTLAALNLISAFLVRIQWKWRNTGLLVMHLGLATLLLSGAFGLAFSQSSNVDLGPLDQVRAGQIPSKWEVIVQKPLGNAPVLAIHGLEAIPMERPFLLAPGAGTARLTARYANGTIAPNQKPMPRPRAKENDANIPALSLEVTPPSGPVQHVSLGENAPFAPLGQTGALIFLQRAQHPLPFSLQLLEFKRTTHPGSTRPKSFESRLKITDAHGSREAKISMNQPVRLGAFTLYQSSWRVDEQNGTEHSILSVVENPIGKLPYYATLLLALGMAIHFLPKLRRPTKALALLCLLAAASHAAPPPPYVPPSLLALPIQMDGRIKSFETFASHTLLELSGKSTLGQWSASQWLAASLLAPETVADLPVFLIQHPQARDALGLVGKDRDRYSWNQIRSMGLKINALAGQASGKENQDRTPLDHAMLHLSDSWVRYSSLVNALAFLREGSVAPYDSGKVPASTFLELAVRSEHFASLLDSLTSLPEEVRTKEDGAVINWFRETFRKSGMWQTSLFPTVPVRDSLELPWESPAQLMLAQGLSRPDFAKTALDWNALAHGWKIRDQVAMEHAARALLDSTVVRAGPTLRAEAMAAEALYNRIQPFRWAMFLFGIAFLPGLIGAWKERYALVRIGAGLSLAALALVLCGMILRMIITLRPPVTNLYETFLFVNAVTVPVLLWVGWWRRWSVGAALASLTGLLLLLVAQSFGADGDTMPVLVAVLDSNFWLTVHVLSITIGYGGVVASGMAAHWHLMRLRKGNPDGAEIVRGLMAFGLVFTFIGTLLGGVWADQSWGRFWGWDPKENGALMIALWAAALFHARACGQIGSRGFSVGSVLSIASVLFAWFGVNLLGVGLHSYGFTQGTLWGLVSYAVLEIGFLVWVLRKT
ncbi:MAG: hypothetical protein RL318_584 [Fibrobacterota bacterium]